MMHKLILFIFLFFSLQAFSQTEDIDEKCQISVPEKLSESNGNQLIVEIFCPIESFHFQSLNRWGNIIYETNTFSTPLNFDYQTKVKVKRKKYVMVKVPTGIYHWNVTIKDAESLNTFEKTGMLTIF